MPFPQHAISAGSFMKELYKEFADDNSGMVAAAVSFYVFLSLTPLLLIAAAAFGFILSSDEKAFQAVLGFLQTNIPGPAASVQPVLEQIIRGSSAATGFGIVSLVWAGSQAFVILEAAINIAWDCKSRGFIRKRLKAIVLMLCVAVLLLFSVIVTTMANTIHPNGTGILTHLADWFTWAKSTFGFAVPLALTIGTFTLIYKMLPNKKVPLRIALLGGVIAGLLWELAKHAFTWYVSHFAHYNVVYGSLASIILLLVWIYYSSLLTIIGAQFCAIYYKNHSLH